MRRCLTALAIVAAVAATGLLSAGSAGAVSPQHVFRTNSNCIGCF